MRGKVPSSLRGFSTETTTMAMKRPQRGRDGRNNAGRSRTLLDRLAESPHGHVDQAPIALFGRVEEVHQQRCGDQTIGAQAAARVLNGPLENVRKAATTCNARAQRVDADTLAGVYHRQFASHRKNGAFRRGVGELRSGGAEERDEAAQRNQL